MQGIRTGGHLVSGRYRLEGPIGRGAMGTVWRAHDELLDRQVAVKEVRSAGLASPGLASTGEADGTYQRTLREAKAAARLNHPGVVTVFDVVEEDGSPWIVMELVPARSLDRLIAEDGPLRPRQAARVGADLISALACAHTAGVLHRDVKPGNVLLGPDDRTVLTDFGIATFDGDPALTQAGMVYGTPGFTAPERIRGEGATPASDLWSLGATLYAAVEGRGPFDRPGGAPAITAGVVSEDAPPAPSAGPLGPVISALLRGDPGQRPGADEAARMLAGAAGQAESQAGPHAALPDLPGFGPRPAAPDLPASGPGAMAMDLPAFMGPQALTDPSPATDQPAFADLVRSANPPWLPAAVRSGAVGPGATGPGTAGPTAAGPDWSMAHRPDPVPVGGPSTAGSGSRRRPRGGRRARWLVLAATAVVLVSAGLVAWSAHARSADTGAPPDATGGSAASAGTGSAQGQPNAHQAASGAGQGTGPGQGATGTGTNTGQRGIAGSGGTGPGSAAAGGGPGTGGAGSVGIGSAAPGDVGTDTLPAGYRWYRLTAADSGAVAGFQAAVPATWSASTQGLATQLSAPTGAASIQISLAPFTYPRPSREVAFEQRQARDQDQYPGYRLVSTGAGTFLGTAESTWRFTWQQASVGRTEVLALYANVTTTAGPQPYTLTVSAPPAGFPAAEAVFRRALSTFEPLP